MASPLIGGNCNDTLDGHAGSYTLQGGEGDDLLLDGIGADTFIFAQTRDEIGDFQNEVDTLVLDTALWGGDNLSVHELGQYSVFTDDGLVLGFGNSNVLTLAGLASINVLNNDLEFI